MKVRNRWVFTLMVLAGALLVTVGNWSIYRGGEVRAQIATMFPSSEFKCYTINHGEAPETDATVTLRDQFSDPDAVKHVVREPQLLCAPAQKIRGGVATPPDLEFQIAGPHLKCYNITPSGPPPRDLRTLCDQFHPCTAEAGVFVGGGDEVRVQASQLLCTLACKVGPAGELVDCPFATGPAATR